MNNLKPTTKVKGQYEDMASIVKSNKEFIVLDIETTGFDPNKGGRIIEIGAVRIRDGKVLDTFEALINPEMPIPKSSTEIHGITNQMVKNAPIYQEVLPRFNEFIGELPVVGHNISFDWDRFLLHYFKTMGIYKKNKSIDTIIFAKVVLPANKGDLFNLADVCSRCGVKLEGAHRALNDVMATAEIFEIAKNKIIKADDSMQPNMLSMFEEENEETNDENKVIERQTIVNVALWEKKFKDKEFKRIYVTMSKGSVFFDIIGKFWQVKDSSIEVDFKQIEEDVKSYLKRNNNSLLTVFN